jgi:EAL domain-containing protein (putative c-di-GMP-specific phosphodiesterase class I)/GGDEF domain-containing protein
MDAPCAALREVLERRALAPVFQPIFAFREARVLGFEALVRGPRGSLVETPFALFGAAQREGVVVELNVLCIQEILRAFAERGLPGTLFLNISPQLIVQPGFDQRRAGRFLASLGLEPERVVIELTEDYPTFDFALVRESLALYRGMGFRVAIDDLGEGFSSLRLWSELKPEFVKADKHFVTGISCDAVKLQFLRAIQHIADASEAEVIAEGIETDEDFKLVRDLGIAFGQGFFIGRPEARPASALPATVAEAPLQEHLDALLRRRVPFCAWVAEIAGVEALTEAEGSARSEVLVSATGRLLESCCAPGLDFVAHAGGARFCVLLQSDDWRERAALAVTHFRQVLESAASPEAVARGYYVVATCEGSRVRPLPRLVLGVVPVLPGVFESRHAVLALAGAACAQAEVAGGCTFHVDEHSANAYPASFLL